MENKKLKNLLKNPVFSAKEARVAGIYPNLLGYYLQKGLFKKISRGIYKSVLAEEEVDFQWEDLVITACSVPKGVICQLSALAIYDLTDEIPCQHWIAVPHSTTTPKRENTKFIRCRDMILGKTTIKIGKVEVPIFNRERTIVDSFRHLSSEVAIKALKEGLKNRNRNKISTKRLQLYAKKRRINLTPYILAITT